MKKVGRTFLYENVRCYARLKNIKKKLLRKIHSDPSTHSSYNNKIDPSVIDLILVGVVK